MALVKLWPIYSCYFYALPIPVYCIRRVNNKELVFMQHDTRALLSSFEA